MAVKVFVIIPIHLSIILTLVTLNSESCLSISLCNVVLFSQLEKIGMQTINIVPYHHTQQSCFY